MKSGEKSPLHILDRMGNPDTIEAGAWEEGFNRGFDSAIDVLKVAQKFEDTGYEPEDVLEDKLKEIADNR